jgi:oligopeptide/dipeptide ABC transporter ATP-binding protein
VSVTNDTEPILVVEHLTKRFNVGAKGSRRSRRERRTEDQLVAVDDVSLTVRRGETLGIVGESGCGKSTLTRAVLRLLEPSAGGIRFDGIDVRALDDQELRRLRRRIQIVFQDPVGSLDPRMTALGVVREPLDVHAIGTPAERSERARRMLELVGIEATQHRRRPYAFSGGQRQRIGIARALVVEPELVFLDEPVSALDVSIQAQVLNLLGDLREQMGLSYVFIVHDLVVAEYFCDRVIVLYRGAVMETAPSETLFRAPLHPYTASLLSAVPIPDPEVAHRRKHLVIRGQVTPQEPGATGCRFRERCPVGRDRDVCAAIEPPLATTDAGHQVACHFPGEVLSANPDLAHEGSAP